MKKFYDRGEVHRALAIHAGVAVGQKQKGGAQALAAAAQQVAGDFADRLKSRRALPRKLLLDQDQVVTDQVENLFDGQKRDGRSSKEPVHMMRPARQSQRESVLRWT